MATCTCARHGADSTKVAANVDSTKCTTKSFTFLFMASDIVTFNYQELNETQAREKLVRILGYIKQDFERLRVDKRPDLQTMDKMVRRYRDSTFRNKGCGDFHVPESKRASKSLSRGRWRLIHALSPWADWPEFDELLYEPAIDEHGRLSRDKNSELVMRDRSPYALGMEALYLERWKQVCWSRRLRRSSAKSNFVYVPRVSKVTVRQFTTAASSEFRRKSSNPRQKPIYEAVVQLEDSGEGMDEDTEQTVGCCCCRCTVGGQKSAATTPTD